MSNDRLTWIHLTDLHVGMGPDEHLWSNARQQVYSDMMRFKKQIGSIDLVFFTGDITQKGSKNEFERATNEIEDLLDHLGPPRPQLLCVPGNHDLELPCEGSGVSSLAESFRQNEKPPFGFWENDKSDLRKGIKTAFTNWTQWAEKNHSTWWNGNYSKGALPGDVVCSTEIRGIRTGVIGMNSAYLQLSSRIKGGLSLSSRQFPEGIDISRWRQDHSIIFVLTHHPKSWLGNQACNNFKNEIAPANSGIIHLFGHNHSPEISIGNLSGGQRVELQGPSLFGLKTIQDPIPNLDRIHGYIIGQIKSLKTTTPTLRLWPRRGTTVAAGGWFIKPDPDSILLDDAGTEKIALKINNETNNVDDTTNTNNKVCIKECSNRNENGKDEILLTRSEYIKKCTELLPKVTTIRATLVGPMIVHPEWYSKRRKPYRLYPDFDIGLRNRIFELQNGTELLDDVRLIFRNTLRYEEKINNVVKISERDQFKEQAILMINKIWGIDECKGPRICCVDTGNLKVAVVYNSTVLTNCRPRSGDPISSGYIVHSKERAKIERATFDQVFEANYTNQLQEVEKLRTFIRNLWKESEYQ